MACQELRSHSGSMRWEGAIECWGGVTGLGGHAATAMTGNCIAANFGTAIAACAGRPQQAMLLLRKLQHKVQPNDPNAVACYSAVWSCKNQQAWEQVSLLEEMRYQQSTSNVIVYDTALNVLNMTERWEASLSRARTEWRRCFPRFSRGFGFAKIMSCRWEPA